MARRIRSLVPLALVAIAASAAAAPQRSDATQRTPRAPLDPAPVFTVYVSAAGVDAPSRGLDPSSPVRSIEYGIAQAQTYGYAVVAVGVGSYAETLDVVDGVSVLGGFAPDFVTRDPAAFPTIVNLFAVDTGPSVRAQGVVHTTQVSGLFVVGPLVTGAGQSSIAVELIDCRAGLRFVDNVVIAGPGTSNLAGVDGVDGTAGAPGAPGSGAVVTSSPNCTGAHEFAGGSGGVNVCRGTNVSGGAGGDGRCPVYGVAPPAGAAGRSGNGPGGGAGGQAGWALAQTPTFGCGTFVTPPAGMSRHGVLGADGSTGLAGSGGLGASDPAGRWQAGSWLGYGGQNGAGGIPGGGGGGGGAGGGVEDLVGCASGHVVGPSGGGGGAGGCAGAGGQGGPAGGASIAVLVRFAADPGGNVPEVRQNEIRLGLGGAGGRGGAGGTGGAGGIGALGGIGGAIPVGFAATGGAGGRGGHGGGGGGGAGGASFGIAVHGAFAVPASYAVNTFVDQNAAGGGGGPGGSSYVSPGLVGVDGALAHLQLLP